MPLRTLWLLPALLVLLSFTLRGFAETPPEQESVTSELVAPASSVDIEPVDDETVWPGLISIFTRGGKWETDPAAAEAYAIAVEEANFGGLMESLDKLELCERHGFKLLLVGDWEEMEAAAPELIENPTILGYYIADHLPPEEIPTLAAWEARFAAADPRHPALFTTEPRWEHYAEFIQAVRPRQLDFYYYQWQPGRDGGTPPHHFEQLEYYRDFAAALGDVRLSRWIHINGEVEKMRQSVSMSLAYNVRGFRWWVGWPMFDLNERDDRGVPARTEVGEEVARINRTIATYAPVYEHLTYIDTYHTEPQLLGTDPVPAEHWYSAEGEEITLGEYASDADDGEFAGQYLLVANRDIENEQTLLLSLDDQLQVALCDKETGEWIPQQPNAGQDEGTIDISLTLEPGGCELVRVLSP